MLAMQENQMAWAACLLGTADVQRGKGWYDPICLDTDAWDRVEAEARFALGEQGFAQILATGQSMTPEQALAARKKVPLAETPMAALKGLDLRLTVQPSGHGSSTTTIAASPRRKMD